MNTLSISKVCKTYPNGVVALNEVTLEINNGMFGLLGPNGAGKSSLLRTLAALQEADSGQASLNQIDIFKSPGELRKVLGYLPQEFGIYPRINAEQLLHQIAILKGISSKNQRTELVAYLLHKVNLYDHRKKALKNYSGGMKQRIGIAQTLIGEPKLIIVDEPTAGLDPTERNRFYNLLSEIGEEKIVILSTHIVQDVSELCTKMAIMNEGKIVYNGIPSQATDSLDGKIYRKSITKSEFDLYDGQYDIISRKLIGGQPLIHIISDTDPGNDFIPTEANLEAVFFLATNTEINSAN